MRGWRMADPGAAPTVYVTRRLPHPGIAPLTEAGFRVVHHDEDGAPARDEVLRAVAEADAMLCQLTERVDDELLDAAPRLRVVANYAVGFDNIDRAAVSAHDVVVTTTPGVLTEATADLTWSLLMAAARRVVEGDALVRTGQW